MARPLTDEDLIERAAVDGRVAFALVAVAAIVALVALLDRVGAPEPLVRLLGPFFILVALATVGALLRSVRVSRFYAAGRAVPTPYLGFASAASVIGLVLPFLPPSRDGVDDPVIAMGAAAGFAVAALVLGPYLRKTGAFSIVDLVGTRFPNVALRLGLAVTVAGIGALVGLAGFDLAIAALSDVVALPRAALAAGLAFVLVLVAAPGGMSGIVWAANGAAGAAFAALVLPAGLLAARGVMTVPQPGSSSVWSEAATQVMQWNAGPHLGRGAPAAIGAALAVAALLPLLTQAVAARDSGGAFRGGVLSCLWSALALACLAVSILWGVTTVSQSLVGQSADRLPEPIYAASAAGLVTICGGSPSTPAAARVQCSGRAAALTSADIVPRNPTFLAAATGAAGVGAAGRGLLAAALLAIGLTVAASGFFLCATALGHDLFYRVQNRQAQSSRRLAVTRALLVATVALGSAVTGAGRLDPQVLVGLAGTLAAAAILPLILLSMNPRAIGRDAVVALLVGLAGAEAVLFAHAPTLDILLRATWVGAGAGTMAGLLTSLLPRGDRTDAKAFVVAVLQREGDVLAPDKGA